MIRLAAAWTLALALMAGTVCAVAVTLIAPLEGEVMEPVGSDPSTVHFVYRYAYPRVAGDDDLATSINGFYQYLVEDALSFLVPMEAALHREQGTQGQVDITHQIMCSNEDYLSLVITTNRSVNQVPERPVAAGHTFALTGDKAGQVVSLPYLLRVLDARETDQWLLDRQVKKANDLVRNLVWESLQQLAEGQQGGWTREMLEKQFFPEEDFYLDEAGQPVFYLQPRDHSPWITIPLPLEEILDAW